jgi:ketosteroid isomerase-like protein
MAGSRLLLLSCMLAAGCVTHPALTATAHVSTAVLPQRVEALVRQALVLDAAGDRAADTLYAADALIVANARMRTAAPRFAGVAAGGTITVAAATVALEGRFAWAIVDYRWASSGQNQAEAGRATFLCTERGGAWKIIHAHSSQVLPWDR